MELGTWARLGQSTYLSSGWSGPYELGPGARFLCLESGSGFKLENGGKLKNRVNINLVFYLTPSRAPPLLPHAPSLHINGNR